MFDAKRLLDQFLGSQGQQHGRPGGGDFLSDLTRRSGGGSLASGALAGGLASVLLGSKSGRKLGSSAVKMGGMALVAGLAYRAYTDWQAKQSGQALPQAQTPDLSPPPQGSVFLPSGKAEDDRARLLVSAMIAAAKADGFIDADEQKRIFNKVGTLDLDSDDKAFLMDQLRAPLDLDGLVRSASGPEVGAEIYAASLLAIDPDHPAEKAYLQMLAARLGLAGGLVEEIHRKADMALE